MAKNENQKLILEILGTRPIAFNPSLAHALGSAKAGLFLSQLLFWWGKGRKTGWIYKTINQVEEETCLSRREQETAIKLCKKYDLIEMRLMGIPAKRHFNIKIQMIIKFLEEYADKKHPEEGNISLSKIDKLACLKGFDKLGR